MLEQRMKHDDATPSSIEQVLLRQRKVLAQFGELALKSDSIDQVLDEACRLVTQALHVEYVKFLELQPDGQTLYLRSGLGWNAATVGRLTMTVGEGTPERLALDTNAPVVSNNRESERRFTYRDIHLDHGIHAFVNVLVKGPDSHQPWGIFEVDDTEPRDFSERDIDFLRGYANLVAAAIHRIRYTDALRATQHQLEQKRKRLKIAAELNPLMSWTADPDGNLTSVDGRWLSLTGLTRQQALRHEWTSIAHPDERAALSQAWEHAIRTLEPYNFQVRLPAGDSYRWVRLRALPSLDVHGRCEQWYGTAEDVTERLQLEEALRHSNANLSQRVENRSQRLLDAERDRATAEAKLRQSQKMEAIGQLTGGIAHDFNNMLASISASLELMQRRIEQGEFDKLARYNELAMASSKRAAALTHRLLAFARQQPLEPKLIRPDQVIAGIAELIRRTVGTNIELTTRSRSSGVILCDHHQLENAVLNLAINARDAMPEGGTLTIETRRLSVDGKLAIARDLAPGEYVTIAVTDTGVGMSPEVLSHAFEPFFTTKKPGEGTGLGLSMIYGFAQQSGGQARIHSSEGMGTSVTLYFPCRPDEAAPEPVTETPQRDSRAVHQERILLVDDELPVRQLTAELLRELGYNVWEAQDSASALDQLRRVERIDLLITDIGLPGTMNGLNLARMIRLSYPTLKVLLITGFAALPGIDRMTREPEVALVTKPFSLEVFGRQVRSLLDAADRPPESSLQPSDRL